MPTLPMTQQQQQQQLATTNHSDNSRRILMKNQLYLIEQLQVENANLRCERDSLQLENEELKFQLQMTKQCSSSFIIKQEQRRQELEMYNNSQQQLQLLQQQDQCSNHDNNNGSASAVDDGESTATTTPTQTAAIIQQRQQQQQQRLDNKITDCIDMVVSSTDGGSSVSCSEAISNNNNSSVTNHYDDHHFNKLLHHHNAATTSSNEQQQSTLQQLQIQAQGPQSRRLVNHHHHPYPQIVDQDVLERRGGATNYELSQYLLDKRIALVERHYGGSGRAQRAAIIIQRAFRKYQIGKRFRMITEQLRQASQSINPTHNDDDDDGRSSHRRANQDEHKSASSKLTSTNLKSILIQNRRSAPPVANVRSSSVCHDREKVMMPLESSKQQQSKTIQQQVFGISHIGGLKSIIECLGSGGGGTTSSSVTLSSTNSSEAIILSTLSNKSTSDDNLIQVTSQSSDTSSSSISSAASLGGAISNDHQLSNFMAATEVVAAPAPSTTITADDCLRSHLGAEQQNVDLSQHQSCATSSSSYFSPSSSSSASSSSSSTSSFMNEQTTVIHLTDSETIAPNKQTTYCSRSSSDGNATAMTINNNQLLNNNSQINNNSNNNNHRSQQLVATPPPIENHRLIVKHATASQPMSHHQLPNQHVVTAAINFQQLESLRKRQYRVGLNIFNKSPERGISFLIAYSFIDSTPPHSSTTTNKPSYRQQAATGGSSENSSQCSRCSDDEYLKRNVAHFLLHRKGLAKEKIGDYLGNLQSPFNQQVLVYYLEEFDFQNLGCDVALRKFLSTYRLPGEAQKIEKIVDCFAQRYVQCQQVNQTTLGSPIIASHNINHGHATTTTTVQQTCQQQEMDNNNMGQQLAGTNCSWLLSKDEIFILTFAIIMLNTDLHSPSLKSTSRMSPQQFVQNLRGVFKSQLIDQQYLLDIYDRVKTNQINTTPDHVTHVMKVQQALVPTYNKKEVPNLCIPFRRLVCFCRLYEVYDINKKERVGQHQREVFLFNDLLLITKLVKRVRSNTSQQYSYRQSHPLQGLIVSLYQSQHYNFGIRLSRRVDNSNVILFNARNELDQSRFVDDLNESIAEMDEMETIRIKNIVEQLHQQQLQLQQQQQQHHHNHHHHHHHSHSSHHAHHLYHHKNHHHHHNNGNNNHQSHDLMMTNGNNIAINDNNNNNSTTTTTAATSTTTAAASTTFTNTTINRSNSLLDLKSSSSSNSSSSCSSGSNNKDHLKAAIIKSNHCLDSCVTAGSLGNSNVVAVMTASTSAATGVGVSPLIGVTGHTTTKSLILTNNSSSSNNNNNNNARRCSSSSIHSLDSGLFLSRDASPNQST